METISEDNGGQSFHGIGGAVAKTAPAARTQFGDTEYLSSRMGGRGWGGPFCSKAAGQVSRSGGFRADGGGILTEQIKTGPPSSTKLDWAPKADNRVRV